MPYLGAGVDQQVNPLPVPTWIFTPTPGQVSSIRVYNEGNSVVWLGGANVSPFSGWPLYPGNKPIEFANMPQTVYSCANVVPGAVAGTVSSASTAAQTIFVLGAAPPASLAAGATFVLGTSGSTGQEVLTVASTAANNTVTTTTGALYDHKASSPVYPATVYPVPLRVTAGVL